MAQLEASPAAGAHAADGGERPAAGSSVAVAAAGSAVWNLAAQIFQTLLGFGTTLLLTRWLRPADYGVFGMANVAVAAIAILGDGGVGTALIRQAQLDAALETTAFGLTLVGGLLLAVGTAVAAPGIGLYFHSREVGVMAAVLSTNFLLLAPGRVSFARLTRGLRFRAVSVIGVATSAVSSGASLLAASRGFGGWSLVVSSLVAPAALSCLYFVVAPPKIVPRLFSRAVARQLSTFGAHLSGFTIAVSIAWLPWTMLLGRFVDASALGLFGMASRLVVLSCDKVGAAFTGVFLPSVAPMSYEERRRAYLKTLRTLAMCVAPVGFGFIAVADELVTVLSARWAELAWVIRGLAVGAVCGPVSLLPLTLLTADGRSATVFRLGLFVIPLTWTGTVVATLIGGLPSFVVVWSVLAFLTMIVFLSTPEASFGNTLKTLSSLGKPVLTASLMGVSVEALQRVTGTAGHRAGLPLGVAAGAVLYLGLGWLIMRDDLLRVVRLLGASIRRSRR